jgi:hypothetical protein
MVKPPPRTSNAPPPVPTVGGGAGPYMPPVDAQTAAPRLGPLLFGDEWILKLTVREKWLIRQGKLDDEPTREARNRQQRMEFQYDEVRDWLVERRITYLWDFEHALAREFLDSRTSEASSPPLAATPAAARQNATRASAKRRSAHNKINDDAAVFRMKKALKAKEASSPNNAALIEAQKLTNLSSGKPVERVQRRLKGKFKKAHPNG